MQLIQFPAAEARRDGPRLVDLVEPYRRYMAGKSRRPEGVARYLWGFRRFVAWLGADTTNADLTERAVEEYKEYLVNDRGAAVATVINALAVLRDFATFAQKKGYRSDDPTANVERPTKQRPQPKPLYPHEIDALIDAIRMPPWLRPCRRWHWERNRRLVFLLLYSGLRLSEAAGLRCGDVKIEANVIVVPAQIAKNGKERRVTLHPRLKTIFQLVPAAEWQPDRAVAGRADGACLTSRGMAKIFNGWLQDELKFDAVHAHRFRHSFACLMLWNKADIKTIQELLGHNQLSTTEWYLEAREEEKRAAVAAIPDFGA